MTCIASAFVNVANVFNAVAFIYDDVAAANQEVTRSIASAWLVTPWCSTESLIMMRLSLSDRASRSCIIKRV